MPWQKTSSRYLLFSHCTFFSQYMHCLIHTKLLLKVALVQEDQNYKFFVHQMIIILDGIIFNITKSPNGAFTWPLFDATRFRCVFVYKGYEQTVTVFSASLTNKCLKIFGDGEGRRRCFWYVTEKGFYMGFLYPRVEPYTLLLIQPAVWANKKGIWLCFGDCQISLFIIITT